METLTRDEILRAAHDGAMHGAYDGARRGAAQAAMELALAAGLAYLGYRAVEAVISIILARRSES